MNQTDIATNQSSEERQRTLRLADMLLNSPIPKDQIGENNSKKDLTNPS